MALSEGWSLFILGAMLLAGYLAHVTGPRIYIPRVTLLLIVGAICGPSLLGLVPEKVTEWFPIVAHMALAIVGFLLGENFIGNEMRNKGRIVLWITISETMLTAALVFIALAIAGAPIVPALVLAGIAPASAPAAILETIREGKSKGSLTDTVLGVVAIDDALGVIIFSLLLVTAQAITGHGTHFIELLKGLWEVFGAILVGGFVSLPMVWLMTNIREGEPTLVEAGGFVFLSAGIATILNVSYLLSAMVLGAVVANRAKHMRPFHVIERIREPFLAIFFILAGLRFDLSKLIVLGFIGAIYIAARTAGLVLGGAIAGKIVKAPTKVRSRVGWCILPQAGVALGFALLAQDKLPEYGEALLSLVIGTTIIFELAGPLIARYNLRKAGELSEQIKQ